MRICFLDFDGVLNSADRWDAIPHPPGRRSDKVDPLAGKLLADMVREHNLYIVVSSTWRLLHTLDELRTFLEPHGIDRDRVIGTTGCDPDRWRHKEIQAWMDDEGLTDRDIVILDDDGFMGPLQHRLINTTWALGLLPEHVVQMRQLWSRHVA